MEYSNMTKIYVTYGIGSNLKDCYSVVHGDSIDACYEIIDEVTMGKYAFSYTEDQFESAINRWKLKRVPLQPQILEASDD